MQQCYDVVIIGGGVVGSAIARELSRYKLRIAVLEKESDVCTQTSGRNTGMLHAGFLYKTGTLKAICAVEGNQEFDKVAAELDVPFKRTGKLIVGFTDEDRQRLENFKARGEANGVKGLEIIDRKRMDELDPSAGGNFAMWCPASGILDPFLYTIALAENAVRNGAEYHLNCAFTGETRQADGTHLLHTTQGDFLTRWVVNSAGLNSAVVSEQLGIPGYVIKPVKGEYFVLDKLAGQFAKIPVYPAPNPDNTFDTHATPTVDGNVLVGPDSQLARDFQDYESTQAAMDGLIESGSRMFKHMDRAYFIRNFAGIRPKRIDPETGAVQDFVLECRDEVPGVVNLVGIESPGLTSALPLARRAVALIAQRETLEPNPDFDPVRHGIRRFADMNDEERVDCDTLILSVGLIPAGDIANGSGLAVDGRTKGAFVDEHYQTSIPGVFSAGNVLHVHDLVDFVSLEAEALAAAAAEYLQKGSLPPCPLEVKAGANVGHVIPQRISGTRSFTLSLRVRQPLKKVTLTVTQNGREVLRRKFPKALPAEMIQLTVPAEKLETEGDLEVSVQ